MNHDAPDDVAPVRPRSGPGPAGSAPTEAAHAKTPTSAIAFPVLSLLVVALLRVAGEALATAPAWLGIAVPGLATLVLIGTAVAAFHHAEAIAARVREPLGTLVLTLSITVIEAAIIASVMLHDANNPTLVRETVFSGIMIVCAGVAGLSLLIGALRFREQDLQPQGTSALLAVLMALSVLTLILPNFTVTALGPTFSPAQLAFVSAVSILLYGAFLFIQTVRHRADFLEAGPRRYRRKIRPALSNRHMLAGCFWLLVSLAGVVLLAKRVGSGVEEALALAGLEEAQRDGVVGALIAFLVLLPEAFHAVHAAARNEIQSSLNTALGAALAAIGLIIPAVAAVSLTTGHELVLGLDMRDSVLLLLTLGLSVVGFGTGRTNVLSGLVLLVVFATYVFLLFVP
jgi:Ca2+:H+ antiporter